MDPEKIMGLATWTWTQLSPQTCIGASGSILMREGDEKLAQHIIRWLNGSSLMLAMKRLRSVSGSESVEK